MTGKVKARICFASLICALMALLTSCDFRLMSKREVDTELEYELNYTYPIKSSSEYATQSQAGRMRNSVRYRLNHLPGMNRMRKREGWN